MAEEKKATQYWRQIDKTTVAFYFNVERAVTDGKGVTHDAGAEVKLSDWVKGEPTEKELNKLQKNYLRMGKEGSLKIGNCKAKIMLPELYGIQYGFLEEEGAFELVSTEYNKKNNEGLELIDTAFTPSKDNS